MVETDGKPFQMASLQRQTHIIGCEIVSAVRTQLS
jgi:hypothetical protein